MEGNVPSGAVDISWLTIRLSGWKSVFVLFCFVFLGGGNFFFNLRARVGAGIVYCLWQALTNWEPFLAKVPQSSQQSGALDLLSLLTATETIRIKNLERKEKIGVVWFTDSLVGTVGEGGRLHATSFNQLNRV